MLDENAAIIRKNEVIFSEMDGELVMMDLDKNSYFGLNAVGKEIWELLSEANTIGGLCATLMQKYNVDLQRCKQDVTAHVDKMVEVGIVKTI
ncbi:MAG: PqqD family peptide modification chaperone [Pseudomonadota bacterium]